MSSERPRNLCKFAEGSSVKSVYTGIVYKILKHYSNGMSVLLKGSVKESWNSCNNQHFVPVDLLNLGVLNIIL